MSKRSLILLLNCILALTLSAQSIEKLLLDGWRFHQGTAQGAEQAAYDDSQWQEVSIPHDWAISGPFDKDIDKQVVAIMENGEQKATEKTGRSGSLPWVGEGWYRTAFDIPEGYTSGELVFDGAMAEPHVWVDGKDVGYWAFGYNVFRLKLGGELMKPGRHTLAVHLQNVEESSRWYPGAGIYRPVRLVLHKEVHIDRWETFVRTTRLDGITSDHTQAERARLTVSSTVESPAYDGKLSVTHTLLDASGKPAGASKKTSSRRSRPSTWTNPSCGAQSILSSTPLSQKYIRTTNSVTGRRPRWASGWQNITSRDSSSTANSANSAACVSITTWGPQVPPSIRMPSGVRCACSRRWGAMPFAHRTTHPAPGNWISATRWV